MTTFSGLVDNVLLTAMGLSGGQDIYCTLSDAISDTDSSFSIDGPSFEDGFGISTGILEVDDELMYAQSADRTGGIYAGVLRGWGGTARAAHADNALVRVNPRITRTLVKRHINEAIHAVFPRVTAVKAVTFEYEAAVLTYDLPAGATGVLSVQWETPGPSGRWEAARRWSFDENVGGTPTITIWDASPGRNVQVTYTAAPAPLVANTDVFTTVTGLPDYFEEVVTLGAIYRTLLALDNGSIGVPSAEQRLIGQVVPLGTSSKIAKDYFAFYQQALDTAVKQHRARRPVPRHYI